MKVEFFLFNLLGLQNYIESSLILIYITCISLLNSQYYFAIIIQIWTIHLFWFEDLMISQHTSRSTGPRRTMVNFSRAKNKTSLPSLTTAAPNKGCEMKNGCTFNSNKCCWLLTWKRIIWKFPSHWGKRIVCAPITRRCTYFPSPAGRVNCDSYVQTF